MKPFMLKIQVNPSKNIIQGFNEPAALSSTSGDDKYFIIVHNFH